MNNPLPNNKHYQTFSNQEPAFPIGSGDMRDPIGLTKREHALLELTKAALTGLVAASNTHQDRVEMQHQTATQIAKTFARGAVNIARATLAELEKEGE